MDINEKNSYINSFTKGMNSDTAFDQIQNTQYIFGQNIRITKNQPLGNSSEYSSVHEGIVAPVPFGTYIKQYSIENNQRIIATESVDGLSIVITTNGSDLHVYKFYIDESNSINTSNNIKEIWRCPNVWNNDAPDKISVVLYRELENVIKLYIATGNDPIITLRVDDQSEDKYYNNGTWVNKDSLINNRRIPNKRVYIEDIISGRLITSQVQYTYRYYNKYGNTTQLAPLTNKLQIIDPSRSKETGNAENTTTSVGLKISIDTIDYASDYERLQVFRLSYITPMKDAEIALIYDGKIKQEGESNKFILNDVGIEPLREYSMDEFSAMSGVILIPKVIEQNQEYLFCGNVKDDTILKGYKLINKPTPSEIKASVVLSDKTQGDIPDPGKHYYKNEYNTISGTNDTVIDYLNRLGINTNKIKASYNDIVTSSLLRSLRRGEEYRYALVFYDNQGRRTDVLSINPIEISQYRDSIPFEVSDGKLIAHPIGVSIQIPNLTGDPSKIVGCQVVRRSSSDVYQKTLLQAAIARPISQATFDINLESAEDTDEQISKKSPFYPTGFLTATNICIRPTYYNMKSIPGVIGIDGDFDFNSRFSSKTRNHKLYQIFSSEIDINRNDILSIINTSDAKISEMLYIPSVFAKYRNNSKVITYDGDLPESMEAHLANVNYNSGNSTRTFWIDPDNNRFVLPNNVISNDDEIAIFNTNDSDITQAVLYYADDTGQYTDLNDIPVQNTLYVGGYTINMGENILSDDTIKNFIHTANAGNFPIVIELNLGQRTPSLTLHTSILSETSISDEGYIDINRILVEKLSSDRKQSTHWIFNFYEKLPVNLSKFGQDNNINQIKDVKIPEWSSAFTEVQKDENQDSVTAIKKYKSYTTNIDSYQYNNWVSFGKYDLKAGSESAPNQNYDNQIFWPCEIISRGVTYRNWWDDNPQYDPSYPEQHASQVRLGTIGAGTSCLLLTTEDTTGGFPLKTNRFYTSICNITHEPKTSDVEADEFMQYFGFGNYFNLHWDAAQQRFLTDDNKNYLTVFDGDIYITPHEFTTMYKAYDFNSVDTLQSTQVVNYIPLESKINTCFDYGMNLMNTLSENLLYEPGYIDGIITQDRPAHQYNMIYSDNDSSNDVFTLISTDENETNQFKQRTYYSDLKTNGEVIDNFLIFKPACFIDVNSKYGEITNLLTDKNLLYYWQTNGCGKFSVNERSLVNDQNSNTIMLGQAGILSRYDQISTKYGMRLYDFCAKSTDNGVFWVDINNKAIATLAEAKAINYGEQLNVQNIINSKITLSVPHVDYDLQNDEIICKCLGEDQLIFNTKYNIATSIYTRRYDDILYIKNHIYGLSISEGNLSIVKYNNIDSIESYLSPIALSFVVNPIASVTKVFDSQQYVPIKRSQFQQVDSTSVLNNTTMSFETDIVSKSYGSKMEPYTDREGNIIYNIPRYNGTNGYGNRIRGKWMKVDINNTNPSELSTISHIITKFRQSYS